MWDRDCGVAALVVPWSVNKVRVVCAVRESDEIRGRSGGKGFVYK